MANTYTTAFRGPYVDQSKTRRVLNQTAAANPIGKSGSRTTGAVTVYDKAGTDHTPDNSGATPPAHAGNKWVYGRDRYANAGAVGQEFLNNPPS